jgi:Membrane bound FAD containing D-sorbitol dehydrogenase
MEQDEPNHPFEISTASIPRRAVLWGGAVLGMLGILGRGGEGHAQTGIPFEGQEPACRADFKPVPIKYEDLERIEADFIRLSEAITGVKPLNKNLARQYLERFASHPQLVDKLMPLIDAFRDVAPKTGAVDDAVISAMLTKHLDAKDPAQQLIYLWYVSAFFLPDDKSKAKIWVYGPPEHYEQALLWQVVRAHAPMTRGGPYGYWADAPSF